MHSAIRSSVRSRVTSSNATTRVPPPKPLVLPPEEMTNEVYGNSDGNVAFFEEDDSAASHDPATAAATDRSSSSPLDIPVAAFAATPAYSSASSLEPNPVYMHYPTQSSPTDSHEAARGSSSQGLLGNCDGSSMGMTLATGGDAALPVVTPSAHFDGSPAARAKRAESPRYPTPSPLQNTPPIPFADYGLDPAK
jgi:hypothetical protein